VSLDGSPNSHGVGGAEWDLFCNTLQDPVQQIIAVEVESIAQAEEVLTAAGELIDRDRSLEEVRFRPGSEDAGDFVGRLETATNQQQEGALVFAIAESSNSDEEGLFWRRLNLLRERIAAIPGQVIFLLLPRDYHELTVHADHLKRWISPRIRLRWDSIETAPDEPTLTEDSRFAGMMRPEEARRVISTMEGQLKDALTRGEPTSTLVENYYIPMFKASVALGDLHRSANLLVKIEEHGDSAKRSDSFLYVCSIHALAERDFPTAKLLAENLRGRADARRDDRLIAIAYHQLGRIAQEQDDFTAAERWYQKVLAVEEKQGNDLGAAISYHQLGMIAEEQRDFATAESWYRKSLAIDEKQGNEHGAAISFHQLGMIAQALRDFATAEKWYRKGLAIDEKHGNKQGAATSYHQLGNIACEQHDFATAKTWYQKSLAIFEAQGGEHGAATSCHQLGRVSIELRDFERAMELLLNSVEIFQRLDPHNVKIAMRSVSQVLHSCPAEMKPRLWELAEAELNEEQIREIKEMVEKLRSE